MSKKDKGQSGATAIEFAILAPLLFLLLFGIVEMSRAVFAYTTVWSGAREGARFATTTDDAGGTGTANYLDCDEIRDAVRRKAVSVDITDADIAIDYYDTGGTNKVADCDGGTPEPPPRLHDPDDPQPEDILSGYLVDVTVTGQFDAVAPLLSIFLDGLDLESRQARTIFVQEQVNAP